MEQQVSIEKQVTRSKVTVRKIFSPDYDTPNGALSAELEQKITTISKYPVQRVDNDLSDNLFGAQDFGLEHKDYKNTETRVTWMLVPKGTTVEDLQAKLDSKPSVRIYKVLSNRPIITSGEKYAIENPAGYSGKTYDDYANNQAVRRPNKENPEVLELALDQNGKIQYRRVAFSLNAKEDVDKRTSDLEDFYASPELKMEMSLDFANQDL